MTGKMLWLSVTLLIFGSSVAAAQTPAVKQRFDTGMFEDIEIMRRLLSSKLEKLSIAVDNNCARCHVPTPRKLTLRWSEPFHLQRGVDWFNGLNSTNANGPAWMQNAVPSDATGLENQDSRLSNQITGADKNTNRNWSGELENWLDDLYIMEAHPRIVDMVGNYLPGYGIVYTVTLPPPQRKTKAKSTKPQAKPLSDWERIRKQLHGEELPDKGQQASAQPKEPSLTDVILKTLFENGHHFVRLNDNDKLTVAITFRPAEQQGGQVTTASSDRNSAASGTSPFGVGNTGGTSSSSATSPFGDATTTSATKNPSSAHDYRLLGDLHMRQGQANDALNAYRSALNDLSQKAEDNHRLSQQLSELHQKLAQAYLALSDVENARKQIDLLEKIEKRQAPKPDNAAKRAETKLPWKLMISAPKKLLERAGSGTITFDAFKTGVTVDELTFSDVNAASPSSQTN